MKYYSIPPKDGVYRVRLYEDSDSYWEYSPGSNSGVALKPRKKSSDRQKWFFRKIAHHTFKIANMYDDSHLTTYKSKDTYWGYGYPLGGKHSAHWVLHRHESSSGHHFAKVYCSGNPDPLDSYNGDWVHFYKESHRENQRWIFIKVKDSRDDEDNNDDDNNDDGNDDKDVDNSDDGNDTDNNDDNSDDNSDDDDSNDDNDNNNEEDDKGNDDDSSQTKKQGSDNSKQSGQRKGGAGHGGQSQSSNNAEKKQQTSQSSSSHKTDPKSVPTQSNDQGQRTSKEAGGISIAASFTDDNGDEISNANGNLDSNYIYVINLSINMVKVHISNNSNVPGESKEVNDVALRTGESCKWSRTMTEKLLVYRALDGYSGKYSSPETYDVQPGQITAVN